MPYQISLGVNAESELVFAPVKSDGRTPEASMDNSVIDDIAASLHKADLKWPMVKAFHDALPKAWQSKTQTASGTPCAQGRTDAESDVKARLRWAARFVVPHEVIEDASADTAMLKEARVVTAKALHDRHHPLNGTGETGSPTIKSDDLETTKQPVLLVDTECDEDGTWRPTLKAHVPLGADAEHLEEAAEKMKYVLEGDAESNIYHVAASKACSAISDLFIGPMQARRGAWQDMQGLFGHQPELLEALGIDHGIYAMVDETKRRDIMQHAMRQAVLSLLQTTASEQGMHPRDGASCFGMGRSERCEGDSKGGLVVNPEVSVDFHPSSGVITDFVRNHKKQPQRFITLGSDRLLPASSHNNRGVDLELSGAGAFGRPPIKWHQATTQTRSHEEPYRVSKVVVHSDDGKFGPYARWGPISAVALAIDPDDMENIWFTPVKFKNGQTSDPYSKTVGELAGTIRRADDIWREVSSYATLPKLWSPSCKVCSGGETRDVTETERPARDRLEFVANSEQLLFSKTMVGTTRDMAHLEGWDEQGRHDDMRLRGNPGPPYIDDQDTNVRGRPALIVDVETSEVEGDDGETAGLGLWKASLKALIPEGVRDYRSSVNKDEEEKLQIKQAMKVLEPVFDPDTNTNGYHREAERACSAVRKLFEGRMDSASDMDEAELFGADTDTVTALGVEPSTLASATPAARQKLMKGAMRQAVASVLQKKVREEGMVPSDGLSYFGVCKTANDPSSRYPRGTKFVSVDRHPEEAQICSFVDSSDANAGRA